MIYIDPYAGTGYDLPADLILVTHDDPDHNKVAKVALRSEDCRIITQDEALAGGVHQTFDLGYATVQAVEAGYNDNHDVTEVRGLCHYPQRRCLRLCQRRHIHHRADA